VVKSHCRERERKRPGETGSGVRQEEDRKETTVEVSKATILRWVQRYAPEFIKR
jgi:hypothetical protein